MCNYKKYRMYEYVQVTCMQVCTRCLFDNGFDIGDTSEKKRAVQSVIGEYDSIIYRGPGFLTVV